MCWWEFGEQLSWLLTPFAWLVSRVWKCRCDARRRWCNEQGERLWAWWNPTAHDDLHAGFEDVVRTQLNLRVQSAIEIHSRLKQMGIGVSLHTAGRWLDERVKQGRLATLVLSGVRHYGFSDQSIVTSSNDSGRIAPIPRNVPC